MSIPNLGFFETYQKVFGISDVCHANGMEKMLKTFASTQDKYIKVDVDGFYHFFSAVEPQFASYFCVCVIYQGALQYANECKRQILLDAKEFMNYICKDFGSCGSISENIIGRIGLCCYGEAQYGCMMTDYHKTEAFKHRSEVCDFICSFLDAQKDSDDKAYEFLANYKNSQIDINGEV